MAEHGLQGLSKSTPGPAPRRSTEDERIQQLEREDAWFRRQLEVKDIYLSLRKSLGSAESLRKGWFMNLLLNERWPQGVVATGF